VRRALSFEAVVTLYASIYLGRAFKDRTGACPNISGDAGATRYTRKSANVRVIINFEVSFEVSLHLNIIRRGLH
jgi:hypothetical protein